jgi:hypothetical protein
MLRKEKRKSTKLPIAKRTEGASFVQLCRKVGEIEAVIAIAKPEGISMELTLSPKAILSQI